VCVCLFVCPKLESFPLYPSPHQRQNESLFLLPRTSQLRVLHSPSIFFQKSCIYTYIHMHTYTHMHTCIYMNIYTLMYIHFWIYIHMYIYIYMNLSLCSLVQVSSVCCIWIVKFSSIVTYIYVYTYMYIYSRYTQDSFMVRVYSQFSRELRGKIAFSTGSFESAQCAT